MCFSIMITILSLFHRFYPQFQGISEIVSRISWKNKASNNKPWLFHVTQNTGNPSLRIRVVVKLASNESVQNDMTKCFILDLN